MNTSDPQDILQKYWGYPSFRARQESIIDNVMQGRDTLALLPTGGGKSLCFQVPVLCQPGLGLVVSPLIALMDDQVQNLRSKGVNAVALHSGMSLREIDLALENAGQGYYKFIYLSPERLQNEYFQGRLPGMKVNLLAVDEAHCISQWGYDFRPPYLEIAQLRPLLPQVPVLALTATATPKVVQDIQAKLEFKEENVQQLSFARANLFYHVVPCENKWQRALQALRKIPGTAVVYLRNRRGTVEVARWLRAEGLSADFYHAGLEAKERQHKQDLWLTGKLRIMVSTNAFGMGIDKPDVRQVIHLELPDSLEAYFQEAGRAGRDGKTSHAVLFLAPPDTRQLRIRHLESFPDLEGVRRVYQCLANYLQLALGSGAGQRFDFDVGEFMKQYRLPGLETYQSLQILSKEGLITLSEGYKQPSRLRILADPTTLYDYQLRYPKIEKLVKTLVRSYGGLDIEYGKIEERELAARLNTGESMVIKHLKHLHRDKLIDYIPRPGGSTITFLIPRREVQRLQISAQNLQDRYRDLEERIESVIRYVSDHKTCRSIQLLHYFGEEKAEPCGHCDVCRRKKAKLDRTTWEKLQHKLLQELNQAPLSPEEAVALGGPREHYQEVLRWLLDEGYIVHKNGKLRRSNF